MKSVFTILLMFVLLVQSNMNGIIVGYWALNNGYITENFCVNKSRPKMQCNGKCYMMKKLKAQETCEKQLPVIMKAIAEVIFISPSCYSIPNVSVRDFYKDVLLPFYLIRNYLTPVIGILQPPK